MNIDFSNDLMLVDNLESATLRIVGQDDFYLDACVLTEPQEWKELNPSSGQLVRQGMLFVWPVAKSEKPPLGSAIIDDDDAAWTILRLQRKQHVETWEAACVNLAVEAGLDNVVTILQAQSYTKNASGEAVPVWTTVSSGISARWQPIREEAQIFEDADYTHTTYRVTFGVAPISRPSELAGGDYRLVDVDGNRYRVTEYIQEERIDALPVAIAVKILEGSEYYDYGGSAP